MSLLEMMDVLEYVREKKTTTVGQIYNHLGSTPDLIWRFLRDLERNNLVNIQSGLSGVDTDELPADWGTRAIVAR